MATIDESNVNEISDPVIEEPVKAAHTEKVDREDRNTVGQILVDDPRMSCRDVNVYYGDNHAIHDVNLDIGRNEVIAMIGPSGCGKSTFLRCLNRMNDTIDICRVSGTITLDGEDINSKKIDEIGRASCRERV